MMANIPLEHGMIVAALLFSIGLVGLLVRRNFLYQLMSVEIMLNSAGLAFVIAGSRWEEADGQIMLLMILAMAASEVAIGLALVMRFYNQFKTLDADAASTMHG